MTRTVLVIEDNHQNRYLVTFLLERHGYTVIAAADGPAGIALARREQPALIVLDIQLPGMDGYTVARILKEDAQLATIPIVAVTSYAMAGDREAAASAGCDGYLEKPIDPDRFALELQRLLGGHAEPPA